MISHLVRLDGELELVERIRTHRNTATVQELEDDAELLAWLAEAGLSFAEAMCIQPSQRGLQVVAGRGPQVPDDATVSCTSGTSAHDGQYRAHVPSDVYIAALLSEDCVASLGDHDQALLRSVCDLGGAAYNASGLPTNGGSSHVGLPLCLLIALRR